MVRRCGVSLITYGTTVGGPGAGPLPARPGCRDARNERRRVPAPVRDEGEIVLNLAAQLHENPTDTVKLYHITLLVASPIPQFRQQAQ